MAKISIDELQSNNTELEQLSNLNLEVIRGELSIVGDFCGGVKFVSGETFTLPNGGKGVRLKPVFIPCIPCKPKPPVALEY